MRATLQSANKRMIKADDRTIIGLKQLVNGNIASEKIGWKKDLLRREASKKSRVLASKPKVLCKQEIEKARFKRLSTVFKGL